jgi:hypothetical protein
MAHPIPSKHHRASRFRPSIFVDLGPNLEFEARLILAWLWAPVKRRLESMLRFGLRPNITTTLIDRSPGATTGDILPRRRSHDGAGVEPASSFVPARTYVPRRGPKRFLAARRGGE